MRMLRAARKAKGLTMKELGEKIGVSESAISQYETGKREADFETILKIGEILDCSLDYLLRGGDSKKSPPPIGDGLSEVSQRFVGLIDKLTPDQQQLLLAQLQAWTEQNEQQAPAAQRSGGEKAPESDP